MATIDILIKAKNEAGRVFKQIEREANAWAHNLKEHTEFLRGAFSAATKLLARELTSTPEPEPKALTRPAAADFAASLPVGVPVATAAAALEVLEVVAVTMIYAAVL